MTAKVPRKSEVPRSPEVPPTAEVQRVVVTGFGPFPGVPENLSTRLVRELGKRQPDPDDFTDDKFKVDDFSIDCMILPTEWAGTGERIRGIFASRPAALLHFGVANHERGLRLEQFAYNECSARADARGEQQLEAPIVDGAPHCLETPMNVDTLLGDLQRRGLAALTSSDPGRYICNQTYFLALHAAAETGPNIPVLFVHIPRAVDGPHQDTFDELVAGAGVVLSHVAQHTEPVR